jgi:hypothetical protein
MRCQHKPLKGKDLVTDVSGAQYLLFFCTLCGFDVVVKLDSDGQPVSETLVKRENEQHPAKWCW